MAVQPVQHRPQFAKGYLLHHSAPANKITDPKGVYSTTVRSSGLTRVYTGVAANTLFHAKKGDSHGPDLVGIAQPGVVYTGVVKKIAENGGEAAADRDVALVVSGARVTHHAVNAAHVQTPPSPQRSWPSRVNPNALQAVRIEHTPELPGL